LLNPSVQLIVQVLMSTFVIPIIIINKDHLNLGDLDLARIGLFYLFYIFYLAAAQVVNKYSKKSKKTSNDKLLANTLRYFASMNFLLSQKLKESIDSVSVNASSHLNIFKEAAVSICNAIYTILREDLLNMHDNPPFKITIYQKFEENNCIGIIAYRNYKNICPEMADPEKYCKLYRNVRFKDKLQIVRIFENKTDNDIVIFENAAKVIRNFKKLNNRISSVKQYIALSGKGSDCGIDFVIELCTYGDNLFGNLSQINDLVDNILLPYKEFLKLESQHQRVLNNLNKEIELKNDFINEY